MQFFIIHLKHRTKCYGVGRWTEILWDTDIWRPKNENCAIKILFHIAIIINPTDATSLLCDLDRGHMKRVCLQSYWDIHRSPKYEMESWGGGTRWMQLALNLVKWRNLVTALLKQQTVLPESFNVQSFFFYQSVQYKTVVTKYSMYTLYPVHL